MVEFKIILKAKREFIVKDLVFNPSPIPSIKFQLSKGVLPSLNSIHFIIKIFKLFSSQTFCSSFHFLISSFLTSCTNTHFDSKILFKNHLIQSVRYCFCEVGIILAFSKFTSPLSHIFQSINIILFDDYCILAFYPGRILNFGCCELYHPL